MRDEESAYAEAVLQQILGVSKRQEPQRPCLICGRHTKYARRVHPNCYRRDPKEAEKRIDEFFHRGKEAQ